jgi:hypothetical protein
MYVSHLKTKLKWISTSDSVYMDNVWGIHKSFKEDNFNIKTDEHCLYNNYSTSIATHAFLI